MLSVLILGMPLWANGVQEDRLARAKQLIADKNYNDALVLLVKLVEQEPDRLDQAVDLINVIRHAREEYNNDYDQLYDVLYKEKDSAKALKIVKRLEELDKNPNKQTQEELRQAKRTAQLVENNKLYNDILTRARVQLAQRNYAKAIAIYLEGRTIARDWFDEENYGNVLTNQVDRLWNSAQTLSTQFAAAEASLNVLPGQASTLFASDGTEGAGLASAIASLRRLADWRQEIWGAAQFFDQQNRYLIKSGRDPDLFLQYSYRFLHGPPESDQPEGILGALDRMWGQVLTPWTSQIQKVVQVNYDAAQKAVAQSDWSRAQTSFEALRLTARHGLDVVTLWNRLSGIDTSGVLDSDFQKVLPDVLPVALWLDERMRLGVRGRVAADDWVKDFTPTDRETREHLDQGRLLAKARKEDMAVNIASAVSWTSETNSVTSTGIIPLDSPAVSETWRATWESLRAKALAEEARFVDLRGALDYQGLSQRYDDQKARLSTAQSQVEGVPKYPFQASAVLQALVPEQASLADDLKKFVAVYDGESDDVKTPSVRQWPTRGRALLAKLQDDQSTQNRLLTTAQANYSQSQLLKKRGQDLVPQISAAIGTERFSDARSLLNQVSLSYTNSLQLQEDPAFRSASDAEVQALFDQILKGENAVVVRKVRDLITRGSAAYNNQLFSQSESLLLQARTLWATTNQEPNTEVEYWLSLANYALSVTNGRVVSPIDPLYNEVQQMLSLAQRTFDEGQSKMAAGDKAGGLATLNQARLVVRKILVPFPQNQEANLLNLKILQASDPLNFPVLFKQNFDSAVARIPSEPANSYNDLQDLDRLQPNYAGMAEALLKVKTALGLIKPPVDVKKLALSKALVVRARRLLDSGGRENLQRASELVNQALTADAGNGDAQALKDELSIKLSGTAVTLTPTQLGEYTSIADLLRAQRNLEALAAMNDFVAKYPGVENESRVKELIRRIKAVN